jgi:drug/metabolite transporter (DMT)-like permease
LPPVPEHGKRACFPVAMIFAFLTTLLWALGAIAARRLVDRLGSTLANAARLVVATVFLAAWAHWAGRGLEGPGFVWFFLSGCVGFGLGDIALYFALARLGSRLTILLTLCLAAPIGALAEWWWLGTRLSGGELVLGAVVLAGVALALLPRDNPHVARGQLLPGLIYGTLAAAGQGLGAAISRKAYDVSLAAGLEIDGGTAAYQRIVGGVVIAVIAWLLLRTRPEERSAAVLGPALREPRFVGTLAATALLGPVIGVACFQWALATTPSGVVLPVVALTPIVIVPFSRWLEGDRPGPRSLLGGAVAVAAAIALAVLRR